MLCFMEVHLRPVCLSQITARESPGFLFPLLANSSLQLEGLVLVGPVRTLFLSLELPRHLKMTGLKDSVSQPKYAYHEGDG